MTVHAYVDTLTGPINQQEVRSNTEEIDSGDDPEVVAPPLKEMIKMWRTIEKNSMVVCTEGALERVKALRQYRAHLQRMSREGEKQTTLDDFFHW